MSDIHRLGYDLEDSPDMGCEDVACKDLVNVLGMAQVAVLVNVLAVNIYLGSALRFLYSEKEKIA